MLRLGIRLAFYAVSLSVFACGCSWWPRATGPSLLPRMRELASQAESITIYNLEALSGKTYTQEQLKSAIQAPFDPDVFRQLLTQAEYDRGVIWKSSRLAVLRMRDGGEARLALSAYGAFFKLLGTRGYFYFKGEAADKWEEAFHDKIIQGAFFREGIRREEQSNR